MSRKNTDDVTWNSIAGEISMGDTMKVQMRDKASIYTIIGVQASKDASSYKTDSALISSIIIPKHSREVRLWVIRSSDKVSKCRMVLTEKCLLF